MRRKSPPCASRRIAHARAGALHEAPRARGLISGRQNIHSILLSVSINIILFINNNNKSTSIGTPDAG